MMARPSSRVGKLDWLCVEDGAVLIQIESRREQMNRLLLARYTETVEKLDTMIYDLGILQNVHSQIAVAYSALVIAKEAVRESAERIKNIPPFIGGEQRWICPECGGYWQP